MAIGSFEEYDSYSAQNRENLGGKAADLESSLIRADKQPAKSTLYLIIVKSIHNLGEAIIGYGATPTETKDYQSESRAAALITSNNVAHLTGYGMDLRKEGNLSIDEREKLYRRFLGEVGWMKDHYDENLFSEDYSDIEKLQHIQTLSGLEKNEELFEKVVHQLSKNKVITNRSQRNLQYLLFPPAKKVEDTSPKVRPYNKPVLHTSKIIEETLEPTISDEERYMRVGFLTEVFGLQTEQATEYVKHMNSDDLDILDDRLATATGDKSYGRGLVQLNPDILTYQRNSTLTKYITTIKSIQEKIESSDYREQERLSEEFGIGSNLREYSTLEGVIELKRQLFQQSGQYGKSRVNITVRDLESLTIDNYALFTDDPIIDERLTQLISEGKIRINNHEYWSEDGGERGKSILIKLRGELSDLFSDLNTTLKPRMDIQQKSISISEDARNVLNTARLYAREHIK